MSRCARRLLPQTTRRALSTSRPACTPVTDAAPTQAKKWTPALEAGQLAAYDESLKFLKADQKAKEAELEKLRGRADAADKIEELEINALVNDPETRWNFTHGQADYSKPVYRYLHDSNWRKGGRLAKLMLRLDDSNILPDVLPNIDPTVDLQVRISPSQHKVKTVKPDSLMSPDQMLHPPIVMPYILHGQEKLYTLALVDPDVPNADTRRYDTYCHQLITNIPLSASRASQVTESQGQTILSYIPPHPNRGTGNHRYVTVLLEQATSDPLPSFQAERTGFNLRDLIATHSLTPVGIHFYRAQWSPVVSTIYSDVLKQQEPRFLKTAPPTDLHKLLRQNQTASQTKWAPFKERLSQI